MHEHKHKLRGRIARAVAVASVGLTASMMVGAGMASASTPADPAGGATPVAPHFYNGNIEGIRDSGSDTTFFMMQAIGDLYTGTGLYGCTINSGTGIANFNSSDPATSTSNENSWCELGQNVSTTDVNDNWDRTEVTEGVDNVGSTAGQEQVCGAINTPSNLPVDFARSSKPAGSYCSTLDEAGYAKDGVPIIAYPFDPNLNYGTSSNYTAFGTIPVPGTAIGYVGTGGTYTGSNFVGDCTSNCPSVNGGVVGNLVAGWLPGDSATSYTGDALKNIPNNDNGGGANSTAYRLWCAADTAGGTDTVPNVTETSGTNTLTLSSGNFPAGIYTGDSVSGPGIPAGTTITKVAASSTIPPALATMTLSNNATASGTITISVTVNAVTNQITDWGALTNLGPDLFIYDASTSSGSSTVTIPWGNFPSTVASSDAVSGPGIPSGTTVSSVSGSSLTLSNNATANGTVNLRITTSSNLAVGQGAPIGVPIRIQGLNPNSGTESTYASYAESGVASGGCTSNMNGNAATDPNPNTATGTNASAHIALENNSDGIDQFAAGDWASPDYADQAIEVESTLYVESRGVFDTNPYAGAVTINGTSYSGKFINENGQTPTAATLLNNTYPTARTLFNIYNTNTVRASVGGFINWICDSNTNFQKGLDNTTGQNSDAELQSIITTTYGFPRLTDTSAQPAIAAPADGIAAPGNTCAASELVSTTAGSNTVTLTAGGNFPVDIVNAGGLVGGGSVGIAGANFSSGTTVTSGGGTNTLTLSNPASATGTSVVAVFSGVPNVTTVASTQN